MKMVFPRRKMTLKIGLAAWLWIGCIVLLYGGAIGGSGGLSGDGMSAGSLGLPKFSLLSREDIDMSADSYEYVGSNLIARGHAIIRVKNLQVTADAITVNLISKDIEAAGHVVFSSTVTENKVLSPEEYEQMLTNPSVKVVADGITTSPTGRQSIRVTLVYNNAYLSADHASGSLETGALQFRNFLIKAGYMYFRGYLAERYPNGKLKMFNSRMTTCEYEVDSNAHYGIASKEMILTPRESNRGVSNYNPDHGEHHLLMLNNFLNVWNVPVFWLPILYKPADSNSFGIRFEFGRDSNWGYYLRTVKEFDIIDEPAVIRAGLIVDYYQERGVGLGTTVDILTANSKTELFAYYLRDRDPYYFWSEDRGDVGDGYTRKEWFSKFGRYELPKDRYEFRLANLTHLTPRLDFRGVLDVISDFNFLEDFFENRYERDVEPPSYAAVEYQGERFSATLQTTFRVNDFFTTVERLPEIRFDFFRQELFKNVYYQGETSAGYYRTRWRKYDFSRIDNPNLNVSQLMLNEKQAGLWPEVAARFRQVQPDGTLRVNQAAAARYLRENYPGLYSPYFEDPEDYESFRFDTLHGFYYPFQLFGFLNLIPRALFRFTAYSDSSKKDVDVDDLYGMFTVDQKYLWPDYQVKVNNYDDRGGARYRFALELGLEGNMKFYRTWQTAKNAFWRIDGLRHVAVPYFNLVYMPQPTESYQNIYYFDEVDQLEKEAFIRLGIQNRLQTRVGNQLYQWVSMENYWDFHFESAHGFNNIGDLGTIFRFNPTSNLQIFSELLLDVGGNGDHDVQVWRGRKNVGRPGLDWDLINRLNIGLRYRIATNWEFSAGYFYSDAYAQRSLYSMGSTLAQSVATTQFRSYISRDQYFRAALAFPTPDKRLKGIIFAAYDVDADLVDDLGLTLRRDFHCWYVALTAGIWSDRKYSETKKDYEKEWTPYVNFTIGLSAMPGMAYAARYDFSK